VFCKESSLLTFILTFGTGADKSRGLGQQAEKVCTVAPNVCGSTLCNLLRFHNSGACKFLVAPRFFKNMWTPGSKCFWSFENAVAAADSCERGGRIFHRYVPGILVRCFLNVGLLRLTESCLTEEYSYRRSTIILAQDRNEGFR
jgi:hypothetical protein